jgi:hypothetical protein
LGGVGEEAPGENHAVCVGGVVSPLEGGRGGGLGERAVGWVREKVGAWMGEA